MIDQSSPAPKSAMAHSRRKALKLALLAGSTLAVTSSSALAEDNVSKPQPMTVVKPGEHGLVKPNSAATPGTSYLIFSGLDFRPLVSSTEYSHTNFSGVYPIASYNYFVTTITLPQQARITELEFYSTHNVSGTNYFYLSVVSPSSGGETAYASATLVTNDTSIVTVPVTVPNGVIVDNTSIKYVLYWLPSGNGIQEVLYGARLGYTGGVGHFAA